MSALNLQTVVASSITVGDHPTFKFLGLTFNRDTLVSTGIAGLVVVILGLATVAITLPRWRRRTRQTAAIAAAGPHPAGPAFSAADAHRLDEDLQREI